jgi:hypothetical protein
VTYSDISLYSFPADDTISPNSINLLILLTLPALDDTIVSSLEQTCQANETREAIDGKKETEKQAEDHTWYYYHSIPGDRAGRACFSEAILSENFP